MLEFEPRVYQHLERKRRIRERLGKPVLHDHDPESFYRQIVESFSANFDEYYGREGIRMEKSMSIGAQTMGTKGIPATPLFLSLTTCIGISNNMQDNFIKLLGEDKIEGHENHAPALALDFLTGFQHVMIELLAANSPDAYSSKLHAWSVNLGLLKQDPKGFLFVDDRVNFWNDPSRLSDGSIMSCEIPEMIVPGAELGAKTYKRMYPIAEKVLSSAS